MLPSTYCADNRFTMSIALNKQNNISNITDQISRWKHWWDLNILQLSSNPASVLHTKANNTYYVGWCIFILHNFHFLECFTSSYIKLHKILIWLQQLCMSLLLQMWSTSGMSAWQRIQYIIIQIIRQNNESPV